MPHFLTLVFMTLVEICALLFSIISPPPPSFPVGVLVITAGKFSPSGTLKCWWHRLDSYDLAPSSPPNPHSREIHLGWGLQGKGWIPPRGRSERARWEKPSPGQEMAHLGRPGCRENKHPAMGQRGRKGRILTPSSS